MRVTCGEWRVTCGVWLLIRDDGEQRVVIVNLASFVQRHPAFLSSVIPSPRNADRKFSDCVMLLGEGSPDMSGLRINN